MEEVFHLYSYGAKTPSLFMSSNDFVRAINMIAVLSYLFGIKILAFCLEDTHLHILVKADIDSATKFRKEIQRQIRRWLKVEFDLNMTAVSDADYLKKVGTYVICQATKDGKHILPTDYRWSSASLYFRHTSNDMLWRTDDCGVVMSIERMSDFSLRHQRSHFHTRNRLPGSWEVCGGMILPSSFVDIQGFESIYKTHNCFRIFYGSGKSSDESVMSSMAEKSGINMIDSEARKLASQSCMKFFGFFDVRKLNIEQRIVLGHALRDKHRMGIPQIARMIYLPEAEVRKVIK